MDYSKFRMAAPLERQPVVFRAMILLPILLLILLLLFVKDAVVDFQYQRAENLAACGEYQQAAAAFALLQRHRSVGALLPDPPCFAKRASAGRKAGDGSSFFHHLDNETAQQMEAFRKELAEMQPPAPL